MGMRLPATFAEAGLLPNPDLDSEVAIGVGEEAIHRTVDLTRSFLPAVLATGVASEEEIDLDTLAERLRADTSLGGGPTWQDKARAVRGPIPGGVLRRGGRAVRPRPAVLPAGAGGRAAGRRRAERARRGLRDWYRGCPARGSRL
jgi:hypothetical protein